MIEIESVKVLDVEKRKEKLVGSYYIYILEVMTSNDRKTIQVYRRYSELYDLHNELLQIFPRHLGFDVPEFPPRTIFKPSAKVATERIKVLNVYYQKLCTNGHMASCSIMKDYLSKRTRDDMTRSVRVKKEVKKIDIGTPVMQEEYTLSEEWIQGGTTELPSLGVGKTVTIIEKTEAGWWLVTSDAGKTQGWIAASYLNTNEANTEDAPEFVDVNNEPYIVTETFKANSEDELSILKGEKVEVKRQFIDGWWLVMRGKFEGMVPSDNLRPASQSDIDSIPKPRKRVKRGQSKRNRRD